MLMSELSNGDCFKVIKVTLAGEIGKRISEMGFTQGTEGKVVRRALLGDPIEICILRYNVSLRKSEADGIEIEKIPELTCVCKRRRSCKARLEKG
ncbi:MAG: FeoA domain-containing protein [Negativicutes bacterium]|jgi:Fe2+ transport system protein FeoA